MPTITRIRNGSKRRHNSGGNLTSTGGVKVAARRRRRRSNASASHRTTSRRRNYSAPRRTNRRRRHNPVARRINRRRRRNPSLSGIGGKVLFAAIGILLNKFITPLIPFGANSPWSNIGKELLVGYGVAYAGEHLLKLSPDKVDGLLIGGMSVGAVDAMNTLLPSLNQSFFPVNAAVNPQLAAANAAAANKATQLGMLVAGPGTSNPMRRNQMGALVYRGRRAA